MMNKVQELLTFILSKIDDLVFVVNDKLQVQAMSAEAQSLFGREEQVFPLSDICDKGDCEAVSDIIARVEERANAETRALLRLPDGRSLPAMLCLLNTSVPGIKEQSFLILAKPLAPRGLEIGKLPGAEDLVCSTESIIIIDARKLEIIWCNKAAEALFGLRREDILGSEGLCFAPTKDLAKEKLRELRFLLESSGILRSQCLVAGPWNSTINCEVTSIAQYDEEKAIAGILCIFRDLGEEMAGEAKLRRIANDLRSCMEGMDSLITAFAQESSDTGLDARTASIDLSSRQIEVARLIVAGETTKSIAQRLGLSESTVKSHITGLFKKTGTKTRAQLIGFIHSRHVNLD